MRTREEIEKELKNILEGDAYDDSVEVAIAVQDLQLEVLLDIRELLHQQLPNRSPDGPSDSSPRRDRVRA